MPGLSGFSCPGHRAAVPRGAAGMCSTCGAERLIPVNAAEGLKPIKRDTVATSEERRPFTLDQINSSSKPQVLFRMREASLSPLLPITSGFATLAELICLFIGSRPNKGAAGTHVEDLRCTSKGTWYLDIVGTGGGG